MASINGLGSNSNAWAQTNTRRAAGPPGDGGGFKAEMFGKLDADGSGAVNSAELDKLLSQASERSGQAIDSAAAFKTLDSNGDGGLDQDELKAGLDKVLGPPPDTLSFASARGADRPGGPGGAHGPPPRPPPGAEQDGDDDSAYATSGTSSSASATDPLDTDGDGTVSSAERAAGTAKAALQDLLKAVHGDGDHKISRNQASQPIDAFKSLASDSGASASGQARSGAGAAADLKALASQVLQRYAQAAASQLQGSLGNSLSVAA